MTFSFFHPYGLILGIAIWVAISLAEKKAKEYHFPLALFWRVVLWVFVGSVIGARAYHVGTDFVLYQDKLWQAFFIWQGGLSIIGAVMGGAIGLWAYVISHRSQNVPWRVFIDLCVFGLPFGQAIGRLGNFFNQELYGLPTQLPWGIVIDPSHRISAYQDFATFHPLFLYEAIFLLGFGIWTWWSDAHKKEVLQVGSGQLFLEYLLYYCGVRFVLDFIRIDQVYFLDTMFSMNQVILSLSFVMLLFFWLRNRQYQQKKEK